MPPFVSENKPRPARPRLGLVALSLAAGLGLLHAECTSLRAGVDAPDAATDAAAAPDAPEGLEAGGDGEGPAVTTTTLTPLWVHRGDKDEYGIGSAAAAGPSSPLVFVRYLTGGEGKFSVLDLRTGASISSGSLTIAPTGISPVGDSIAIVGRGPQDAYDYHVQWMSGSGVPRATSLSVQTGALATGVVPMTAFIDGQGKPWAQTIGGLDNAGGVVKTMVSETTGLNREPIPCGATSWWDADSAVGTERRYFLGVVQASCDLGDGQAIAPKPGEARWVLTKFDGKNGQSGRPFSAELTDARSVFDISDVGALGVSATSVWTATPGKSGKVRLESFSAVSLKSQVFSEASGPAVDSKTAAKSLTVVDVVPHPTRDRVYLLLTVKSSEASWSGTVFPTLTASTVTLLTFDTQARLLGTQVLAPSAAAKSGSHLALVGDRLFVSGQCESTPQDAVTDPLCAQVKTSSQTSFVFALDAP